MRISNIDRIRLVTMLGMLGSDHVGERDNAANLIEQFLRKRGLTWNDLLAGQVPGNGMPDMPGARPQHPFHQYPPNRANLKAIGLADNAQDAIWRWSMVVGLVAIGVMTLVSLIQQHSAAEALMAEGAAGGRCPVWAAPGPGSTCIPFQPGGNTSSAPPPKQAVAKPAGSLRFDQGLADRKLSDTWHKSAASALCERSLGAEMQELKSACDTAAKLLKQFDGRRRADPEYRRGWNSLPVSSAVQAAGR